MPQWLDDDLNTFNELVASCVYTELLTNRYDATAIMRGLSEMGRSVQIQMAFTEKGIAELDKKLAGDVLLRAFLKSAGARLVISLFPKRESTITKLLEALKGFNKPTDRKLTDAQLETSIDYEKLEKLLDENAYLCIYIALVLNITLLELHSEKEQNSSAT